MIGAVFNTLERKSAAMTGFVFGMMMCGMMCEMYTMCMCMPENKDGRVISSLI